MLKSQQELNFSQYTDLYDKLIPQNHLFRKINELIDFSFIREELKDKYCPDNGRTAEDPEYLFKFLFLKCLHPMSDVDLVERALYDLSYKYFLGLNPEDEVINASTLSKFRKLRLKDTELLDMLIEKTVQIAMDKGIIESKSIIVDATHTKSRYNSHPIREVLQEHARRLRKEVYSVDEKTKNMMPAKNEEDSIEKEVEYCERLLKTIEGMPVVPNLPRIIEKMNLLKETMEDTKEEMYKSTDEDAKTGYKSSDTSFFGYKTHIAMTPERIITAATITSGEKPDGKELPELVEKSRKAGMTVENVIADRAYSGKDNLTLAVRKAVTGSKKTGSNQAQTYYFDIEKCKQCPHREGCYKEGAKSKTFSVTLKCDEHKQQQEFQETEEFKQLSKERYKIEAKNSELKNVLGYDVSMGNCLYATKIQGACTIFAANIKRIITILDEK